MSIKTAGLVIIGNEVLDGLIKDENTHFLCRRFNELGVRVDKIVIVGDSVKEIAEEVKEFSTNFNIVITSGGVGPTHDDVTYEGVAAAFGVSMESNEELTLFWKNDPDENAYSISKMSTVPSTSKVIYSELPESEKEPVVVMSNVYMFPGSPALLQKRFTGLENSHFNGNGVTFHKREIFLCVDECAAVPALNETVNQFTDVAIGSYPEINDPQYSARITINCHDLERVVGAYNLLVSLLDPSWIIDPIKLSPKNKL